MAVETAVAPRITSRNPATGEALGEVEVATPAQVRDAVARAKVAQRSWSQQSVRDRVRVIQKFQRALHENKKQVAELITREAGKPYVEALLTEVIVTLDAAKFCAETAWNFLRPQPIAHGNLLMKSKKGYLLRQPHGVIGIISPWNYPFSIPAGEVLAALVTGHAVVLKPSEFTPLCGLKIKELFALAGLPEDLLHVLPGDAATGAALLDSAIDKIIFTGSVSTGRKVAQAAAARLTPVVLELGGKDPMLVLDDANVDVASSAAAWGAFVNAGQTCLSVERCYVHRNLYAKFLEACVAKTKQLHVGNGMDESTDIGPMIHQQQLQTVESHVTDAIQQGARLLTGGHRLPELGANFYAPTVLADVTPAMRIMREETFGPVLPVMAFDSDDQAVRLANDSEFGLAASIWTTNRSRGEDLARRIEAGTVMVNDVVACFGISEAPHGGVKSSGLGRTHGRLGLEEMVRTKYVDSDYLPRIRKVWWYGYGRGFPRQIEGFVDFLFSRSLAQRLRGGIQSLGAYFRKGRL